MKRTVFCLCMLVGLMMAGCGEKLTESEQNAPPPRGPQGGYVSPPPGAVKGNPASNPRAGIPGGGGPAPGAPGGPAPMGR